MQDFTLKIYKKFLHSLLANGYSFQTLENFIEPPNKEKIVILRHDVDRKPENALVISKIEKEASIRASYYFRIVKKSYDEDIIKKIAEMGHEIGYHYEDVDLSSRGQRSEVRSREKTEVGGRRSEVRRARARVGGHKELDDSTVFDKAIKSFERNLSILREVVPVKTICMHGSPLSKWDNRELWKRYDYRDYGIIAEPYFDINWQKLFYLTDTGRKWNNTSSSVRDKLDSGFNIAIQSTSHLIALAEQNALPHQVMINTHPQRWTDNPVEWAKELVWQNVKNVIKKYFYVRK